MVSKLFYFFKKESNRITEAAFLIGVFALLSQVLGLLRDRMLAHVVGPGTTLDIYYAGFRIPDIIYNSISTLFSITVLLPFFIHLIEDKNDDSISRAGKLLNQLLTVFVVGVGSLCLLAFILMPWLSHYVAPGFSAAERSQLVILSRLLLLSPILLGVSNLFGTITQIYKRFVVYALTPVVYNIGIIFGIFFLLPYFGVVGLGIGVIIGAFLQVALQVPVLASKRFFPRFTFRIDFKEMKRIIFLSLPRTLGLSLSSITLSIIIAIATTLHEGAVSIFNFSFNLQSVPITIIGLSYSVAVFPMLSFSYAQGNIVLFKKQLVDACRQVIFWSLPVMFLFIVLRAQIVRVILGSGKFSWNDTRLTAAALALFTLSVLAQSLTGLLVRGYYAAGKTWRPLLVNLAFTALEVFTSLGCLYLFHHSDYFRYFIEDLLRVADVPGTDVLMLALGYSIGTIANYYALWFLFKHDFLKDGEAKPFRRTLFQSFCGAFFMGFTAYEFLGILSNYFDLDTVWGILMQGVIAGIAGIIVGVCVLVLLKNEELKDVYNALHRRIFKNKIIITEDQHLS